MDPFSSTTTQPTAIAAGEPPSQRIVENRGLLRSLRSLAVSFFLLRSLTLFLSQIVLFKRSRPIGIDQS